MTVITINATVQESVLESLNSSYVAAHNASSATAIRYSSVVGSPGTPSQRAGQAKASFDFYVWRSGLVFDTSVLAGYRVVSATLNLWAMLSALYDEQALYVVSGDDLANPLVAADFGDLLDDTVSLGSVTKAAWITAQDSYCAIPLNAAGLLKLNKSGVTKLALRSWKDINIVPETVFIVNNFYAFYHNNGVVTTQRPQLVVTVASGFPTNNITRVTNLIHRYNRAEQVYTMECSLGDVTSDFGLPEWAERPQYAITPTPPTTPSKGIIPHEPAIPEDWGVNIPVIITPPKVITPPKKYTPWLPIVAPEVLPPYATEDETKLAGQGWKQVWRAVTPWKEEKGETFGEWTKKFLAKLFRWPV